MTNPYGEQENNQSGNDNPRYGNLPHYEATNHPEDRPDFGLSGPGYRGYEANAGYVGGSNYDQSVYSGNSPMHASTTMPADGKIHVIDAFAWAFRTTFGNAKLWLVAGLLMLVVFGGISVLTDGLSTGANILNIIGGIVSLVVGVATMRLALFQIDDPATGWTHVFKDVPWGLAIAVSLICSVVSGLVVAAVVLATVGGIDFAAFESMAQDPSARMDDAVVMDLLARVFTLLAIMFVGWLIFGPLTALITWFAVDKRAGVVGSIIEGVKAGARHYFPLLGFLLLYMLLMLFGTLITVGLGAIVLIPVSILSMAHVYRQAVGGPVPAMRER